MRDYHGYVHSLFIVWTAGYWYTQIWVAVYFSSYLGPVISWRCLQKHWASIHRISQFVCEKLWCSFAIRFWQTLGREFLYKKAQRSSFGRALQYVGLYFLSASFLKKNNVVETHTYPFIKYFEAAVCDISKQNIALPTWLIVSNTVSILWNSTNWHLRLRSQKSRFWPAI